ncbi:hypothetical protein TWF694_006055 [Orbilia ellipsospora]|uniref:Uncharacterized protein n=1 Tax=Orbilia ellipsospora TaxID=2528407 RepID=A0AAV9WTD5_9PEZI
MEPADIYALDAEARLSLDLTLQQINEEISKIDTLDTSIATDQLRIKLQAKISNLYHARFMKTGNIGDNERAILIAQKALKSSPTGSIERRILLNTVGVYWRSRFEATKDIRTLRKAIKAAQRCLKAVSSADPMRELYVQNLRWLTDGRRFLMRVVDASLEDLYATLELAIAACPIRKDKELTVAILFNILILGCSYTPKIVYIDRILEIAEGYLKLVHEDWGGKLVSIISNHWVMRFDITGDLDDLCKSIDTTKRAVIAEHETHDDWVFQINQLIRLLRNRYKVAGTKYSCDGEYASKLSDIKTKIDRDQDLQNVLSPFALVSVLSNLWQKKPTADASMSDEAYLRDVLDVGETFLALAPSNQPCVYTTLACAALLRYILNSILSA